MASPADKAKVQSLLSQQLPLLESCLTGDAAKRGLKRSLLSCLL